MPFATFNRFEIEMTRDWARACSHPGPCDQDVAALLRDCPGIRSQLDAIDPDTIRAELREYGAWDSNELADDTANRERIAWIAAGNIADEVQP